MKKICILLSLLFLINFAFGQNLLKISKKEFLIAEKPDSGAWKSLVAGKKLFELNKNKATEAANKLIVADNYNNESAKLKYNIGLCYLYTPAKEKAIKYFEEAEVINNLVSTDLYFVLARAYHLNTDYKKAVEFYEKYKATVAPADLPKIESNVDVYINECKKGIELTKNETRAYVDNLGGNINSAYHDYFPFFNEETGTLYFTSQKQGNAKNKINKLTNSYFEKIYSSEFVPKDSDKTEEWAEAKNMGKIFSSKSNDALVGLSADGNTAFIYKGAEGGGDLYISVKEEGEWTKPKSLGPNINDKKSKESSATISADGNTLYFTSNKDGGYGGSDIYFCTKDTKGKWREAKNLSSLINSSGNEISVCLAPDEQTLYFASNGHVNAGGYDIFKTTKKEDGTWSAPVNLGAPINTARNQLSYVPLSDEKTAFYSSESENSFGGLDIYRITFLGEEKPIMQNNEDELISFSLLEKENIKLLSPISSTVLSGKISSKRTGGPISATIEIIDKEENKVIYSENSDPESGSYEISLPAGKNYSISIKSDSYMFASDNIEVQKSKKFQRFTRNFELSPLEIGAAIILKNVFFDSNKATLREESFAELDILAEFINNNQNVTVEISGHTDNIGSTYANKKLSKERAESVVQYLKDKGTNTENVKAVGYGHTKPVATNKTKEGRQINRRVEAKIINVE